MIVTNYYQPPMISVTICFEDNSGKQYVRHTIGRTVEEAEENFKQEMAGKYKKIISVENNGFVLY